MANSRYSDGGAFGLAIQDGDPRESNLQLPPSLRSAHSSGSTLSPDLGYDLSGSDTDRLTPWTTPNPQMSSSGVRCRSRKDLHDRRSAAPNICTLLLAVYSVVLSGIWLGLAVAKPHYHQFISVNGTIRPETAPTVAAAIAKSIELAFVTVFIAFVGQSLSRKAIGKASDITISDFELRTFIMQPGAMFMRWRSLSYSGRTVLGVLAVLASLSAMLYTTASDALVAPKISLNTPQLINMQGRVFASFNNKDYIERQCQSVVPAQADPEFRGSTCLSVEHSGQSFHNFMQYMSNWTALTSNGKTIEDSQRPSPMGTLFDNTTIKGTWIDVQDMNELSNKFNRIVNNVTAALPHGGIFSAAQLPTNDMISQSNLKGGGEFNVDASVILPAINVLCAEASGKELEPIVYEQWPDRKKTDNLIGWPSKDFDLPEDFSNKTVLDDVFGWSADSRRPPIFPKLPIEYNTVLSAIRPGEDDALYLLGADAKRNFMVCALSSSLESGCSTKYHATISGGSLVADCSSRNKVIGMKLAFSDPSVEVGVRQKDWVKSAVAWAMSLSLNTGISDANAAAGRLLTQLIPTTRNFNPTMPSLAEGLAELAVCTTMTGVIGAPFDGKFNFDNDTAPNGILKEPITQTFQASVQVDDYRSGPALDWQNVFYVVLTLVFILSAFCFIYFIFLYFKDGIVTDFMEPQNLFALAINSPPSQQLAGSCGGGPDKDELRARWRIRVDEGDHVYIGDSDHWSSKTKSPSYKAVSQFEVDDGASGKVRNSYQRISGSGLPKLRLY